MPNEGTLVRRRWKTVTGTVLVLGLVGCGQAANEQPEVAADEEAAPVDDGPDEPDPPEDEPDDADSDSGGPDASEPDPDDRDPGETGGEEGEGPIDHVVVDSQAAIPQEPAGVFADIATDRAAVQRAWSRFELDGEAPELDVDRSALLFLGMGESGSCPALIDELRMDDGRLVVVHDVENGPICTDDYRPRTFVVEVAVEDLPDEGFELQHDAWTFTLSTVPLEEPPSAESMVGRLTAEDPQVELTAETGSVSEGETAEMVLANDGEVYAGTGSWSTQLFRWEEQRWLPADGQPEFQAHPAVDADPTKVEPGERRTVMTIDADELEPGWYRVVEQLQLGGRGGRVDVQGTVEIVGG